MKISNRRMLEDINVLKVIAQKQMPIKASYAIAKNLNKIDSELKIYSAERDKLIDKYSQKDENGKVKADANGQIDFGGYEKEWDKDITELMNIENDIEVHTFKFDELASIQMSPAEIQAIDYMIEE